jgi:hypothetical protein
MKGKSKLATHEGGRIRVSQKVPKGRYPIGSGRTVDLRARLKLHERVEKRLMDKGMSYRQAHQKALDAEHKGMGKKQVARYEGKLGSIARD